MATNLNKGRDELDRALQILPIKLTKIGRTAIYGSFFNFYLCQFQGNVVLPTGGSRRSPTTSASPERGATSDERAKRANSAEPPGCGMHVRRPRLSDGMSTPFRERNPVKIGAISIAVMIALLVVAFKAGDLPLIGGGDTYHADFTEAGGLKANDEVRIAGVRVGKVTGIDLDGNKVNVTFKVNTPSQVRHATGAQIKVKTLLGAMYLSLVAQGVRPAREGRDHPGLAHRARRTTSCRRSPVSPTAPSASTPRGWRPRSTRSPT